MGKESIYLERDADRLIRRLRRVTAGDLTGDKVRRLAEGDLDLVEELSLPAQQAVRALIDRKSNAASRLEKMVGVSLDYVPVAYLDRARLAAGAVARVVDTDRRAIGTGTMVSPQLLLTNNHVLPDPATAAQRLAQFDYELAIDGTPHVPSEFKVDAEAFFWTSPVKRLDATLVAIGTTVSGSRALSEFRYCPLSGAGDKHAYGDFVTVVQHPDGDYKQVALRENRLIGRGKGGTTLHYSADTEPGSSGSPVFNDQFDFIALHHVGGVSNETHLEDGSAVPPDSNEGIRLSAIVKELRDVLDDLPERYRAILAAALDPPMQGPVELATGPATISTGAAATNAGPIRITTGPRASSSVGAELSLPLRLLLEVPASPTATLADAAPAASGAATVAEPTGVVERNQPPDPKYGKRRGYDPDFLGISVPMPALSALLRKLAAIPEGETEEDGLVLRYLHFSLVQNAERRMPFFTAVNIDGAKARNINRTTGEVEASEKWYLDPRIAAAEQLDDAAYHGQPPKVFDRGHMVRRIDPAWGSDEIALRASFDTFHFTNSALQVSAFNQRAALWQGIENYVLDNAKAERQRINVLTGPMFAEDDPAYGDVFAPQAFWKIVVRVEDKKLRCTGFIADQQDLLKAKLELEGIEGFDDLGKVAVFQARIAAIEKRTGLDLGELPKHDTAVLEASEVPLERLADVAW
jgi:endonuclease G, mitochondrial